VQRGHHCVLKVSCYTEQVSGEVMSISIPGHTGLDIF
jgi:hypothetical protein